MVFKDIAWEDIRAGQIVKVKNDEDIPCDILLLYSSNDAGVTYVDTMALDGETNLKEKNVAVEGYLSS